MSALIVIAIALGVACFMEAWAALLHRFAWHGPLWRVHRTHHSRRSGRFEANDALSALHAPIAAAFIVWGCQPPHDRPRLVALGVGAGMTAFGVAYVAIHDGFVHRRLPMGWLTRVPYFASVARAHRVHHALASAPYGFFAAPLALRVRSYLSAHARPRARAGAPTAPARRAAARPAPRGTPRGDAPTSHGGSG